MNMYLLRRIYTPTSTIGDLIIDFVTETKVFCHTLEDVVRKSGSPKVPGKTAIPAGRYEVNVSWSPKFCRIMPILLDVPNFEGIRMHGGNTAADTAGCILVAKNIIDWDRIHGSHESELTALLKGFKGPHFIEIIDTYPYFGAAI